jgi:hypothetical protein
MKKTVIASAIMMMCVVAMAAAPGIGDGIVDGSVLSGQHYSLNIIGVDNPKKANMDDNSGHVIFVDLNGTSKIELVESGTADAPGTEADDFAVLDKNGTDRSPAVLALPDPGLEPYVVGEETEETDTITNYSIFVRPLGSPQGEPYAKITTCADVLESFETWLDRGDIAILNRAGEFGGVASVESTGQLTRTKGQSIFTNQTAALLTIVLKVQVSVDLNEDGDTADEGEVYVIYVRVPIFDDMLANEYWEYDNNGLKLLQVRIYRVGTDVSNYDNPEAWDSLPLP